MDTTATLPPPAAIATGPASRRHDGLTGQGFAATLKLVEAPSAAAPVADGPGPPPAVLPQGAEAVAAATLPSVVVPAPLPPDGVAPDMGLEKTPVAPLSKPVPDAGTLPPALPVPLPETEVASDHESPTAAAEEAELPEAEPPVVPPPPTLPVAPPLPAALPAISPGVTEVGDDAAASVSPQAPPAAPPPPHVARAPIDRPDPAASAAPGAQATDRGTPAAPRPLPAALPAAAPITAGSPAGEIALPEAAEPAAPDALPAPRPGPSMLPDRPPPPSVSAAPAAALAVTSPPPVAHFQTDASPQPAMLPSHRAAPAPRDRPMMQAASAGQATAIEATTASAPAASPVELPPERLAAVPPEHRVPGMSQPPPEAPPPATPQPPPPDAGSAAPAGLSPPPAAAPADPPIPTRPTTQPPPPARQVAQVAIALSLGTGQAPRLTVALEPEALGRVEIRIERGAEGEGASVRVLAERPETLALLQRDVRELDRALSQAGVLVAEGALQFGLSSGDSNKGGRHPGSGGAGGRGGRGPALPAEATRPVPLTLSLLDIAV